MLKRIFSILTTLLIILSLPPNIVLGDILKDDIWSKEEQKIFEKLIYQVNRQTRRLSNEEFETFVWTGGAKTKKQYEKCAWNKFTELVSNYSKEERILASLWVLSNKEIDDKLKCTFLIKDIRAIDIYINILTDKGALIHLRCEIPDKLRDILEGTGDKRVTEALISVLKEEDWYLVDRAMVALGEIGDERAIPHFLRILESGNKKNWQVAAVGLCVLGSKYPDRSMVEPLLNFIKNFRKDNNWGLDDWGRAWYGALHNIGLIGDKRALPILREIALDEERFDQHRVAAMNSLGHLGDVETLAKLLKDENSYVRMMSAEFLGKTKKKEASEVLNEALKTEKDEEIIEEIQKSLKKLSEGR